MSTDRSRQGLMAFLDYLANKGLMSKNTAMSRKAAANKVLGILSEEESVDVVGIDLEEIMLRFQNLKGQSYAPGSLNAYKSRIKSALDDFEAYLSNPLGFKPNIQTRERKLSAIETGASNQTSDAQNSSAAQSNRSVAARHASIDIVPIPIRSDLTIHIQGLPFDLSKSEAQKISNVVLAMVVLSN